MSEAFGTIFFVIITPVQEAILRHFAQATDREHFYLTGGTALAYFYLKHRRSNDLDFFTSVPELVVPFSYHLEGVLRGKGMSLERRRATHSFVEFFVQSEIGNTVIQLAQDSPFRFESPAEFSEFPGLKVDDLRDIASNKLLALFGRAALRDFIDIYTLITRRVISKTLLFEDAKRKDPGFDLYWAGIAFERIHSFEESSSEMLMLLEPVSFKEIVGLFDEWQKEIVEKLKP